VITYTVADLETLLKIKKRSIRKFLINGELGGRFVGRQWIVTEDSLKAFLELSDKPGADKR
jgi:excisionase family DNA binding protein